jgi:hypothetical protein
MLATLRKDPRVLAAILTGTLLFFAAAFHSEKPILSSARRKARAFIQACLADWLRGWPHFDSVRPEKQVNFAQDFRFSYCHWASRPTGAQRRTCSPLDARPDALRSQHAYRATSGWSGRDAAAIWAAAVARRRLASCDGKPCRCWSHTACSGRGRRTRYSRGRRVAA